MSNAGNAASTRLDELDALLEDLGAKAQDARPRTIEEGSLSYPQTLALGLFVSAFEVYLGMRALLRERLAEEARMLSRTLLDDTARLMWLGSVRDDAEELDKRALHFEFDSIDHEGKFVRMGRDSDQEWADEEQARLERRREAVTREAESRGITLARMPKPRDLLRSLGQERLYLWHVRASQSIHSSGIGLSARFRPGATEDSPVLIPLESTVEEVVRVGVMAVQAFSLAIVAANDVMGWGRRDELAEYRERVVRLSSEFDERVKGELASSKGGAADHE